MTETVSLSLGIDAAPAQTGAALVIRSLDDIIGRAEAAAAKMGMLGTGMSAMRDAAGLSSEQLSKVSASVNNVNDAAEKAAAQASTLSAAIKTTAQASAEATPAAEALSQAHGRVGSSSTAMREALVLVHEMLSGNYRRAVGSATIELQALFGAQAIVAALTNPLTLGIAAATGAFVAYAVATAQTAASQREIQNAIALTGDAAGVTRGQMETLAQGLSSSTDLSVKTIRGMESEFTATGKIGGDLYGRLISLSAQFAKATGEDAEKVGAEMAKTFSSFNGIEELDKKFNFLTETQAKSILAFKDQGDIAAAAGLALDAFGQRVDTANTKLNWFGNTLEWIKRTSSNFFDNIGKASLDPTVDEQIAAITKKLSDAKEIQDHVNEIGGEIGVGQGQKDIIQNNIEVLQDTIKILMGLKDAQDAAANAARERQQAEAAGKNIDEQLIHPLEQRIAILKQLQQYSGDPKQMEIERARLEAMQKAQAVVHDPNDKSFGAKVNAAGDAAAQAKRLEQALQPTQDAKDYAKDLETMSDQLDRLADKGGAASDIIGHQWDGAIKNASLSLESMTDNGKLADGAVDDLKSKLEAQAKAMADGNDVLAKSYAPGIASLSKLVIDNAQNHEQAAQFVNLLTKAYQDQADAQQAARDAAANAFQDQADEIKDIDAETQATLAGKDALKKYKDEMAIQDAVQAYTDQLEKLNKAQDDDVKKSQEDLDAMSTAYENAMRRAKAASDDLAKQEQADNQMQKVWDNAAKEIQSTFASTFENIISGGAKKFQDFGQTLLNLFAKIASQIAAALVFNPVIGSITSSLGIGSAAAATGSSSGGSSTGSGLFSIFSNIGSSLSKIWGGLTNPGSLFGSSAGAIDTWGANNLGMGSTWTDEGGTTFIPGSGTGLSSTLGAAGLGGLGGLAANILGVAKNSFGGIAGAAVGAISSLIPALSSVAGPIGLAVGFIASLFGPSAPHMAGSQNFETDGTNLTVGNALGRIDTSGLATTMKGLQSGITQILGALGGSLALNGSIGRSSNDVNPTYGFLGAVQNADGTTSYHVGIGKEGPGGKWSSYDQDGISQQDVAAIVTRETLKYLVQSGQTSGLSATTQQIVGSTKFGSETDTNQIQADLTFADTYDQIIKLADSSTKYGQAASSVTTALDGADKFFADATTQAQALGLATDQFATAAQNAKTTIGTGFLQGLQDELDNAQGKGFLKSLRDYETTAAQQFTDLKTLFDRGAIDQSQLDIGTTTAKALQAQMISNALAQMTATQITDVVASFANDTTDFGKAIEAAALAVQNGTSIVSGSGIDAQTFHDQTQVPMDAALRNAQSALDPTVKAFNDALNLQEQRDVALRAALAVDNLSASQKSYIETTMKATWALQDQAAAAQKAQTAMANATTTIANLGTTINDYINKASVDQYSGKSPAEILQATKTQYETQMQLAQEGNADALGSITTYAQNYRQAIQTYYGTGTQGASLSQGVLDQLSGLPNTPGLATALANNTLRNQGDGSITIGSDGSIYQNGEKIGFSQNPTAPNDISAFDQAAGQYNNGMSAQAYQALVGIRDAILSGYTDTQLQAVSNKYYGGVTVGSLSGFESLLHSMDTGWLNSPNQPWNQSGGSESGGNAPLIKASNDNADTISKSVQAMQKSLEGDLSVSGTNIAAFMQTFRDQTHLDLVGPTGSVAFGLTNVAATIHADFTGTLGQAVNSLTTLVASLQAALQASQNQVAGLTAQLMAAQQAMADQAAADAKKLVDAVNKNTAVTAQQSGTPGGRQAA